MGGRWQLASLVMIAMPLTAGAATLPIDGSYGNKAGCRYATTGESDGSDDFFLLAPNAVTTATAHCEVRSVGNKTATTIDTVLSCQAEGEESGTELTAQIVREGKDAYKINFKDGTLWGPLAKCR